VLVFTEAERDQLRAELAAARKSNLDLQTRISAVQSRLMNALEAERAAQERIVVYER
jgi:hypothetical protein